MKKIVALIVAGAMSLTAVAPAFAGQKYDVYLRFDDGRKFVYDAIDGDTPTEQFAQRIVSDFPQITASNIIEAHVLPIGSANPFQQSAPRSYQSTHVAFTQQPAQAQKESGGSVLTDLLIGAVSIAALVYLVRLGGTSKAYPCILPTDRARDGSLCGGRASSVRPGGR